MPYPILTTYGIEYSVKYSSLKSMYLTETDMVQDFWYCQFTDSSSFKVFPIETIAPKHILDGAREKRIFLVLDNTNEAFNKVVDGIYENIVDGANIPASQIILVTGGADVGEYVKDFSLKNNREPIKVEWSLGLERLIISQTLQVANRTEILPGMFSKETYTKKFLNLNRRWRRHRPALLALMYDRGLIKDGHISFGISDDNLYWDKAWYGVYKYYSIFNNPEMYNRLTNGYNVKNILPLYLDTTDLVTNRASMEESIESFYLDTYFSVVSETTFNSTPEGVDGRFLTEKTFKAISYGHPFILVAPPRSLELLKKLGYRTFRPYINEAYDLETDDSKRLTMIVDEIERLSNLEGSELQSFLSAAKAICEINFKIFMERKNFIYKLNYE